MPGRHFLNFYQPLRFNPPPPSLPLKILYKHSLFPLFQCFLVLLIPPRLLRILLCKIFGFLDFFHFVSVNFLPTDSASPDNLCAICDCRVQKKVQILRAESRNAMHAPSTILSTLLNAL